MAQVDRGRIRQSVQEFDQQGDFLIRQIQRFQKRRIDKLRHCGTVGWVGVVHHIDPVQIGARRQTRRLGEARVALTSLSISVLSLNNAVARQHQPLYKRSPHDRHRLGDDGRGPAMAEQR